MRPGSQSHAATTTTTTGSCAPCTHREGQQPSASPNSALAARRAARQPLGVTLSACDGPRSLDGFAIVVITNEDPHFPIQTRDKPDFEPREAHRDESCGVSISNHRNIAISTLSLTRCACRRSPSRSPIAGSVRCLRRCRGSCQRVYRVLLRSPECCVFRVCVHLGTSRALSCDSFLGTKLGTIGGSPGRGFRANVGMSRDTPSRMTRRRSLRPSEEHGPGRRQSPSMSTTPG